MTETHLRQLLVGHVLIEGAHLGGILRGGGIEVHQNGGDHTADQCEHGHTHSLREEDNPAVSKGTRIIGPVACCDHDSEGR